MLVGLTVLCGTSESTAADDCAASAVRIEKQCVPVAEAVEAIRGIVLDALDRDHLRSAIVAVQVDGRPLIKAAWGESLTGVPARTDMHFRNGAIAISYLGVLLLQLRDEGLVTLDDKLSRWFPDYPNADRITLQMLANSTSGYEDYVPFLPLEDDVFRHWKADELVHIAFSKPVVCEPGTCFHYSHVNFVILGSVLEKVTGLPLDELLRRRVIEPLGLRGTVSEATALIQEPVLHAYTNERGVYEDSSYWDPSWTIAPGAVMTTDITDALASAVALGSGSLLSDASHRTQLAPITATLPPFASPPMNGKTYYGFGIVVSNSWVFQTPSFSGYSAAILYLPPRRIAIAVTSTNGPEKTDGSQAAIDASQRRSQEIAGAIANYLAPDVRPLLPGQ
jgi:Beta-lactamase class C and other penicillin binding proteins